MPRLRCCLLAFVTRFASLEAKIGEATASAGGRRRAGSESHSMSKAKIEMLGIEIAIADLRIDESRRSSSGSIRASAAIYRERRAQLLTAAKRSIHRLKKRELQASKIKARHELIHSHGCDSAR